jgi:hypothetical protein
MKENSQELQLIEIVNNMDLEYQHNIKPKRMYPHEVDTVIYHDPCSDGTASYWVARYYFEKNYPNKKVDYIPMSIGSYPPNNLDGKNVLICDYSYRKDVLINLLKKVNNLLIIDHHKSAEKDLKDINDQYKIFDMAHSGAMLTWMYFFPDVQPPLMIRYVEDRDIWTNKMPNINDFVAWFYTLPFSYEEYNKYANDELLLNMIATVGKSYSKLNNYYIDQVCDKYVIKFQQINGKYYFIAYVNSTILKSDVGNKIFEKYPNIDFAVVYSINDYSNSTSFSLRSTNKHMDVSDIAFKLGGGGHKCASGLVYQTVTNVLPGIVYDNCGALYANIGNIYFAYTDLSDFIKERKYYTVYLNSNIHKFKLARYLLQTKFTEKIKTNQNDTITVEIQECNAIEKIIHQSNFMDTFDTLNTSNMIDILNTSNIVDMINVIDISVAKNELQSETVKKVQIACVWDYNYNNDVTSFCVVLDKSLINGERKYINNYFKKEQNNQNGQSLFLQYKGFHKFLPINIDPLKESIVSITEIIDDN